MDRSVSPKSVWLKKFATVTFFLIFLFASTGQVSSVNLVDFGPQIAFAEEEDEGEFEEAT